MRTIHSTPVGEYTVNELPGECGATVLVAADRVRAITDAGVTNRSRADGHGGRRTVFVIVRPYRTTALLDGAEFEQSLRRHRGVEPGTSIYTVRHFSAGKVFPVEITTLYGAGAPTLMPYVPNYRDPQEQHAILSGPSGLPVGVVLAD